MEEIDFAIYYERIVEELKKDKKRNKDYFDTLELLIQMILSNNEFNELERVARLRDLVYSNGSLSKKQLKNIDKELGYEKYYEESFR